MFEVSDLNGIVVGYEPEMNISGADLTRFCTALIGADISSIETEITKVSAELQKAQEKVDDLTQRSFGSLYSFSTYWITTYGPIRRQQLLYASGSSSGSAASGK